MLSRPSLADLFKHNRHETLCVVTFFKLVGSTVQNLLSCLQFKWIRTATKIIKWQQLGVADRYHQLLSVDRFAQSSSDSGIYIIYAWRHLPSSHHLSVVYLSFPGPLSSERQPRSTDRVMIHFFLRSIPCLRFTNTITSPRLVGCLNFAICARASWECKYYILCPHDSPKTEQNIKQQNENVYRTHQMTKVHALVHAHTLAKEKMLDKTSFKPKKHGSFPSSCHGHAHACVLKRSSIDRPPPASRLTREHAGQAGASTTGLACARQAASGFLKRKSRNNLSILNACFEHSVP
jgi:hypothetical protein